MKKIYLDLKLQGQRLDVVNAPLLAQKQRGHVYLRLLSKDCIWENYEPLMAFFKIRGVEAPFVAIIENNECRIPDEVFNTNSFKLSIAGGSLLTTDVVQVEIKQTVYSDITQEPSTETEKGFYEQIFELLSNGNNNGSNGGSVIPDKYIKDIYVDGQELVVLDNYNCENRITLNQVDMDYILNMIQEYNSSMQGQLDQRISDVMTEIENKAIEIYSNLQFMLDEFKMQVEFNIQDINNNLSNDIVNLQNALFIAQMDIQNTFNTVQDTVGRVNVIEDNINMFTTDVDVMKLNIAMNTETNQVLTESYYNVLNETRINTESLIAVSQSVQLLEQKINNLENGYQQINSLLDDILQ